MEYINLFMIINYLLFIGSLVVFVQRSKKNKELSTYLRGNLGIDSLGNEDEKKENSTAIELVINQYRNQQQWSFGLVFFSIALSLIVGLVFLVKFNLISKSLDWKSISNGVALVGEISLSVGSFKLYKFTSKRLDNFVIQMRELNEK